MLTAAADVESLCLPLTACKMRNLVCLQVDPAKTEPPLKISLPGREYQLSVTDVINMPTHDFASLCRVSHLHITCACHVTAVSGMTVSA